MRKLSVYTFICIELSLVPRPHPPGDEATLNFTGCSNELTNSIKELISELNLIYYSNIAKRLKLQSDKAREKAVKATRFSFPQRAWMSGTGLVKALDWIAESALANVWNLTLYIVLYDHLSNYTNCYRNLQNRNGHIP